MNATETLYRLATEFAAWETAGGEWIATGRYHAVSDGKAVTPYMLDLETGDVRAYSGQHSYALIVTLDPAQIVVR